MRAQRITSVDAERMYVEALNEVHPPTVINLLSQESGEVTILAADILRECDPIGYQTGLNDFEDSLTRDGEYVIVDEDDDVDEDDEVDEDL